MADNPLSRTIKLQNWASITLEDSGNLSIEMTGYYGSVWLELDEVEQLRCLLGAVKAQPKGEGHE